MTLHVLVPSSLVRECRDKREATRKIGYVARAATIFRASRVIVFPDTAGEGEATWDGGFVDTVLRYAVTPPHLRKDVWESRDELEAVGVLPPLRISTQTGSGSIDSGSLRQGIVTEVGSDDRVRVNCGMQHPLSLRCPPDREYREGERVFVRITSRRPIRASLTDVPPPGPTIERMALEEALDRPNSGLRIATSRHGEPLTSRRLNELVQRIQRDGQTVAFGAPQRGLREILEDQSGPDGDPPDGFDLWLNAIPDQGSDVVRTEEAMFAALACLTLTE